MENLAIFVSVIENEAHTRPRDAFDRRTERKDRPFNGFGLVGAELPYHRIVFPSLDRAS